MLLARCRSLTRALASLAVALAAVLASGTAGATSSVTWLADDRLIAVESENARVEEPAPEFAPWGEAIELVAQWSALTTNGMSAKSNARAVEGMAGEVDRWGSSFFDVSFQVDERAALRLNGMFTFDDFQDGSMSARAELTRDGTTIYGGAFDAIEGTTPFSLEKPLLPGSVYRLQVSIEPRGNGHGFFMFDAVTAPEPGTAALLATGLVFIATRRRQGLARSRSGRATS